MELHDENGRKMVEYENAKGAKVYTGAEKHIEGADFSDQLSSDLSEEEVTGLEGFDRLSGSEQKDFLKKEIDDYRGSE